MFSCPEESEPKSNPTQPLLPNDMSTLNHETGVMDSCFPSPNERRQLEPVVGGSDGRPTSAQAALKHGILTIQGSAMGEQRLRGSGGSSGRIGSEGDPFPTTPDNAHLPLTVSPTEQLLVNVVAHTHPPSLHASRTLTNSPPRVPQAVIIVSVFTHSLSFPCRSTLKVIGSLHWLLSLPSGMASPQLQPTTSNNDRALTMHITA